MEEKIKITVVPANQICEEHAMIRISTHDICAWGNTISEAIAEFDKIFLEKRG